MRNISRWLAVLLMLLTLIWSSVAVAFPPENARRGFDVATLLKVAESTVVKAEVARVAEALKLRPHPDRSDDPIGLAGELNLYAYAPNPLFWIDPLGLKCSGPAGKLNRKLSALESAQDSAVNTRILPDGRIRYYDAESLARTPGPTRGRSHVTEWNPKTGDVRSWEETYNHSGQVNRVHPKMKNGELLDLPHYPPTKADLDAGIATPSGRSIPPNLRSPL